MYQSKYIGLLKFLKFNKNKFFFFILFKKFSEAVTIKLTPRSIRSSKSKTVNQKIKKIPPLKSKEIDDIHLTELENKNDFNEIKTLQEEER